jgi:uncharacterized membrane protein
LTNQILGYLDYAGKIISLVGALVVICGFLFAIYHYWKSYKNLGPVRSFVLFKVSLGRSLILGLEILVLADVVETIVVKPTFLTLLSLGILVILRTILSWTLSMEIEGHWPWQTVTAKENRP